MSDVTQLLNAIEEGDANAASLLLPLVYDELRQLAQGYFQHEKPGQTLQPTALVHEAFLRLVGQEVGAGWKGRAHFLATAALAMRHILVDHARRKRREKHGGLLQRVELSDPVVQPADDPDKILALDVALTNLAQEEPQAAELVQLHTFGGLSVEDAGAQLGLSRAAAYRLWSFARAWLRCEISEEVDKR